MTEFYLCGAYTTAHYLGASGTVEAIERSRRKREALARLLTIYEPDHDE